jgi:glycosyltransferase involved in cell wall biosynthesis
MPEKIKPLVSVLMTAYNREKYIAEAIESVLASTYQNWELIIVDDQSMDNTLKIVKTLEEKDKRIRVFQNEKNLGDYSNRNKAANYAKGKYLKYLDADDIIYRHALEVMVNSMEQFPEAGLGTQVNIREYPEPYPTLLSGEEVYQKHFLEGGLLLSGPTGTIIRRDAFEKISGFSGKRHVGDTELWLKLAQLAPVVIFQPALIWWRQHPDQEMKHEMRNDNVILNRCNLNFEVLLDKKSPLTHGNRKRAIHYQKKRVARLFFKYLLCKPKFAYKLLKIRNFKIIDIYYAFVIRAFMK